MILIDSINWWAECGKVVISGGAGYLFGILSDKTKKLDTRSIRAASYFDTLAGALEGMADSFEKRLVPYKDGHLLDAMLEAFDETTSKLLDEDLMAMLKRLNALSQDAEHLDGTMRDGDKSDPEVRKQFIDDARRVAGELRAKAALLRTK